MDRRKRVFSQFALAEDNRVTGLDSPALLRALLLFEGVIVHGRFEEFGHFARLHGIDATVALLRADGLKLEAGFGLLGHVGRPICTQSIAGGMLRVSGLDFVTISPAKRDHYLDKSFDTFRRVAGLTPGRSRKLENTVRSKLLPQVAIPREEVLRQTEVELEGAPPALRAAIELALQQRGVTLTKGINYRLDITATPRDYVVDTDLHRHADLPHEDLGSAIAAGILAFGSLDYAIDDMRRHTALVGFPDRELPLLDAKLSSLAGDIRPQEQGLRLSRVLSVADLPEIDAAGQVDIERLLEVRQSPEAKAFRDWLWGADSVSDDDIRERFNALRYRLGAGARTKIGKVIRWAASTGLGAIPPAGTVLGAAAGLVDTFLVEKVLPDRGPLSFLGDQYRSLFEK